MNTWRYLLVAVLFAAPLSAVTLTNYYNFHGTQAHSGNGRMVILDGALEFLGKDTATGKFKFRQQASAKYQDTGAALGVAVLVAGNSANSSQEFLLNAGTYSVQIARYDNGWWGFSNSTVSMIVTPDMLAKLRAPKANCDVLYTFYDKDGKKIGSQLVPAGETPVFRIPGDASGPVSYMGHTVGGYWDDTLNGGQGGWVDHPTQVSLVTMGTIDPGMMYDPSGTQGPNGGTALTAELTINGLKASPGTGSVTSSTTIIAATTSTVGAQDATLAAVGNAIVASQEKGTQAITKGLAEIKAKVGSSSGSSGGTGTDMTATNTLLDGIKTETTAVKDKVTAIHDLLNAGEEYDAATDVAQIETKAGEKTGSYNGAKPTGNAAVSGGQSAPGTLYSGDLGFGTMTLGFGSLGAGVGGAAHGLMSACRPLLVLALCVWFARGAGKTVTAYATGLGAVSSGSSTVGPENIVPGVAQAKGWGSAGVAVTTIVVAVAAFIAAVDVWLTSAGVGVAALLNGTSWAALGSFYGLVDAYIPVAVAIQLSLFSAALPYVLSPIYVVAMGVLKFARV